jgi:Transmembrane secretion effector
LCPRGGRPGGYAARRSLAERAFRWFFAGRVVSLFGSAMTPVALAFAVLRASVSTRDLGIVSVAHTVPLIAFVIPGGSFADRYSRGAVLRMSNFGAGVTQGIVAYLLISGLRAERDPYCRPERGRRRAGRGP